ncbi:MAG: carboxypeptidase-like regulatory domain-containing protein [Cyclobacteriaceae bacterium]
MNKFFGVVLIFIAACTKTMAADYLILKGTVYSETTRTPLPYVNIYPEGTSYGTFSNLNGQFEMVIQPEDYTRALVVTFIGYANQKVAMDTSRVYKIYLKEQTQQLPEITVTGLKADQIIEKFLEKREMNYPHYPLVHKTFLREYEQAESGENVYLNEAIVDYHREGYFGKAEDAMKLVKGRNRSFNDEVSYVSGGFGDIRNDLVKYPKEFLTRKSNYIFDVDMVFNGDRDIYRIAFIPKKNGKYEGYLYIEDETFALVKAEVYFSETGISLLNKSAKHVGFSWEKLKETIVYKKSSNGKYHLSEIITNGRGYDEGLTQTLTSTSELVVIETDTSTFFANEFYPIINGISLTEIDFENTPFFWEDNNYIVLEKEFQADSSDGIN